MFETLNRRVSIVLFIIAVLYLVLAYQIPSYPYTEVDADVIPKILGWLLILLSSILYFSKDEETEEQKEKRNIPKKDLIVLVVVAIFILVYILLLEPIGFVLMTALFIFFCSWFLGYKKHISNVIVSLLFPLILYLIFTELLNIQLPSGGLPF